ncbi:hypothetical protein STEG23_019050 [Scotinomys teguina]
MPADAATPSCYDGLSSLQNHKEIFCRIFPPEEEFERVTLEISSWSVYKGAIGAWLVLVSLSNDNSLYY